VDSCARSLKLPAVDQRSDPRPHDSRNSGGPTPEEGTQISGAALLLATRVNAMNVRADIREVVRISRDIGLALRTEQDAAHLAPLGLNLLLKDLETRVRDTECERLIAQIDVQVGKLLRASGRAPHSPGAF
jgi:hypothetical protein